MWSNARDIAAGDTVIIWLTRDVIQPLVISPGKELNGRFGCYRHADLVGKPYGSKIRSRNGRGFIHVLRPTPELWTLALPHRTQILYLADIAFITAMLGIKPGSKVIEAGTGSGSFSHSIARTIGPSGHLYTFEFHEVRANKARDEFDQHGMTPTVTLTHRNVCKDGFELEDAIDSVFLDLPAPWDAVEHAKKALVKDRTTRICCFSPCIEQVLRSVSALNDAGFSDITMYEALLRPHDVYSTPTLISIDEVAQRLKSLEQKAETRRLSQIAQAQVYNAKKRKRPEDEQSDITDDVTKKRRSGDDPPPEIVVSAAGVADMEVETNQGPLTTAIDESGGPVTFDSTNSYTVPFSVSKPLSEVRGHTSYLTFASLLPSTSPGPGSSSQSLLSESDKALPQISPSHSKELLRMGAEPAIPDADMVTG